MCIFTAVDACACCSPELSSFTTPHALPHPAAWAPPLPSSQRSPLLPQPGAPLPQAPSSPPSRRWRRQATSCGTTLQVFCRAARAGLAAAAAAAGAECRLLAHSRLHCWPRVRRAGLRAGADDDRGLWLPAQRDQRAQHVPRPAVCVDAGPRAAHADSWPLHRLHVRGSTVCMRGGACC